MLRQWTPLVFVGFCYQMEISIVYIPYIPTTNPKTAVQIWSLHVQQFYLQLIEPLLIVLCRCRLLVSETLDSGLLGEHIITTLVHAWKNLASWDLPVLRCFFLQYFLVSIVFSIALIAMNDHVFKSASTTVTKRILVILDFFCATPSKRPPMWFHYYFNLQTL